MRHGAEAADIAADTAMGPVAASVWEVAVVAPPGVDAGALVAVAVAPLAAATVGLGEAQAPGIGRGVVGGCGRGLSLFDVGRLDHPNAT